MKQRYAYLLNVYQNRGGYDGEFGSGFYSGDQEVGGEVELGSTVEEIQQSPRATRVFGRRGGTQVNKAAICYQPNPRVSVITLSS